MGLKSKANQSDGFTLVSMRDRFYRNVNNKNTNSQDIGSIGQQDCMKAVQKLCKPYSIQFSEEGST